MTEAELKDRLTAILAEEDRHSPDWQNLGAMCLDLSKQLSADPCEACPHDIYHFIADVDIRKNDQTYADKQRAGVHAYLRLR